MSSEGIDYLPRPCRVDVDCRRREVAVVDVEQLENTFLPEESRAKSGRDNIFAWYARYQQAKALGEPAINGTVGSLLENDGSLAVNSVVSEVLRSREDIDISGYAPLAGLPEFIELAPELAIGPRLAGLHELGLHTSAVATPGGTGALYLSARTALAVGDTILLRSLHWSPYDRLAQECGLKVAHWPIIPEVVTNHPKVDLPGLEAELESIASNNPRVLSWLNDPAHNPTGLSLDAAGRELVLDAFIGCARAHPKTGVTLLLDTAYAVYAQEPYGWSETICSKFAWVEWPENLLICWAFSASKSHTIYGMRCGAIIFLHPSEDYVNRVAEVCTVTGRGTWSLAPRLPQATLLAIHRDETKAAAWAAERDRLLAMLRRRRRAFNDAVRSSGMPLLPSDDGYFAYLPCDAAQEVAERAAENFLYVIPMNGGVRIGLCSIPDDEVERAAEVLINAWRAVTG